MDSPLDLVRMALLVGASFVGRSFSGDKAQMVPLIMAAMSHQGPAFIDVSPRGVQQSRRLDQGL